MQISDIASPTYSVSSNCLRLNASSVAASTPSCDVDRPLVHFEEFTQPPSLLPLPTRPPKKRLTIDIDDLAFDQQEVVAQGRREEESRVSASAMAGATEWARMRQQLEGERARAEALEREREFLLRENEQLRTQTAKREEMLEVRQHAVEELSSKLAQAEAQLTQERFYDEKLREKEAKYRELKKDHEKIAAMNRNLQRELRDSERKIMDLEKEIQSSVCANQYETILKVREASAKLKESSLKVLAPHNPHNKENARQQDTLASTVKSLDKKKPATQPKKTTRLPTSAASTANFAKKLQLRSTPL